MFSCIPKTKAKQYYNSNITVYLTTSKISPYSIMCPPARIHKGEREIIGVESNFDDVVKTFEFYRCNKIVGVNVKFYVDYNEVLSDEKI